MTERLRELRGRCPRISPLVIVRFQAMPAHSGPKYFVTSCFAARSDQRRRGAHDAAWPPLRDSIDKAHETVETNVTLKVMPVPSTAGSML